MASGANASAKGAKKAEKEWNRRCRLATPHVQESDLKRLQRPVAPVEFGPPRKIPDNSNWIPGRDRKKNPPGTKAKRIQEAQEKREAAKRKKSETSDSSKDEAEAGELDAGVVFLNEASESIVRKHYGDAEEESPYKDDAEAGEPELPSCEFELVVKNTFLEAKEETLDYRKVKSEPAQRRIEGEGDDLTVVSIEGEDPEESVVMGETLISRSDILEAYKDYQENLRELVSVPDPSETNWYAPNDAMCIVCGYDSQYPREFHDRVEMRI
jgi:hypothetical protein